MIILDAFIPVQIKSGNKFTCGKWAMFAKKGYREKWGKLLSTYAHNGPWWPGRTQCPEPVKIYGKYVRYMGITVKGGMEKELDQVNLEQGIKLIMDNLKPVISHAKKNRPAIVGLGWIYDDAPQWHEYKCIQTHVTGIAGLGIVLSTEPFKC